LVSQIKSKQRVTDHGEVFTSEREVNAMLDVVETRYKKNQLDYERYSVIAVSSIYGVELLTDNVEVCRERLFDIFVERYTKLYKKEIKVECIRSIKYILNRNIVVGDALTLKTVGDKEEPIVFSEWSSVNGSMVKRRDYTLANLLANQPMDEPNLFSDLGDKAFLPTPVKDYPLIHFLKIGEEDV
jgi:hypothetical protein